MCVCDFVCVSVYLCKCVCKCVRLFILVCLFVCLFDFGADEGSSLSDDFPHTLRLYTNVQYNCFPLPSPGGVQLLRPRQQGSGPGRHSGRPVPSRGHRH